MSTFSALRSAILCISIGASLAADHYWFRRGGDLAMSSSTPHVAPSDLSQPTWVWNNPLDEEVRHSPLIDKDFNVYVGTGTRVLKFDKHGKSLWTWQSGTEDGNSSMVMSPHLHQDSIFVVLQALHEKRGYMYSLDLATGNVNWRGIAENILLQRDASNLLVANDTLIFGSRHSEVTPYDEQGLNAVHARSTKDGSFRWEYQLDDIAWNFSPAYLGDGTIIIASQCGGIYRIDITNGNLLYRSGEPNPGHRCGVGGGALGPDGVFYTNWGVFSATGSYVSAYRVSDGHRLWNKTLDYIGLQYPGVGRLGSDGPVAVVAPIGHITGLPRIANRIVEKHANVSLRNAVVAMDAKTGDVLWRFEEPAWPHLAAAGDVNVSVFVGRMARSRLDPRVDFICLPDIQGIPVISGDGTVYGSSSHSGDLYAIRDANGNGVIEPSEVSVFATGNCFLNSPSVAPGMLVAAPCWGPMYVWLDETQHPK